MDQKTAILLVVVLITGITIGYIGGYMTFPTTSAPDEQLAKQITTLQTTLEAKEEEINNLQNQLQDQIAILQQQVDELESRIVTLNQEIQNLQAQIEQRTEESEEPEFARKVIYIPCSEAEAILNITYEFEYFIGSNIKFTIKNIGTEVIGYKVDGTPGDFGGYFIVRVSAQDPYGRNITTWDLPYEFRIVQIEHAYEKDITSLCPKEEVFRRVSIPYYPEEYNIKTYTIEVKYVSD